MATSKTNISNILIIATVIVLIGVIGWLLYDRSQQKQISSDIISNLERERTDKQSLTLEYHNLLADYEYLKTDNDTLNAKMNLQQERIKQILDELKTSNNNSQKIKEYQEELKTLRLIMKDYIKQIDSLNTANQQLTQEKDYYKSNYEQEKTSREELIEENTELTDKVDVAATLMAKNISVIALNKRGKTTRRVRRAAKLKVCFTMPENAVAKQELKNVFIRIADPSGMILTNSVENLFKSDGDLLAFSAKRQIEYNGKDTHACIFWTNDKALTSGRYSVDVFSDGKQIGTASFTLN